MAKITLNIVTNIDKSASANINAVSTSVETLANSLNKINPNKELTAQLRALADSYKGISATAKQNTRDIEANAKMLNAQTKARAQEWKETQTATKATQSNTKATQKSTATNKQHTQSILSMASGFLKWQLAATLIMQPLQKIREAIQSINETLVKTEDTVISLQRVLDETIANEEISDKLYSLAERYAQTFDNVSAIATNFARTGMSWVDTIKATEAALLALNVAELDATQASNGMIAIMQQFGKEASDLEGIIDMLNKTADGFAVSTDKLLKALQRTGSSAKNANLTLEETIGIVTALSEATGRSGENLGTAVNSLIQYSSKASALDIFASLDEGTANIVEQYRVGAATILDVWEEVSRVINNMDERQESILADLANSEDIKDLNSELSEELGDIFEQVSDVYGTANTFRKNYFIALLGNMKTVREAAETAMNAAGYSQTENLEYLNSYTAKVNQLAAAWQHLANDEQGWLSFKKDLAEFGIEVIEVIDDLGGLSNVLKGIFASVITFFVVLKGPAIFGFLKSMLMWLPNAILKAGTAWASFANNLTSFSAALKASTGIIGLLSVAVGALVLHFGSLETEMDKAEKRLEELKETAESTFESIDKNATSRKAEITMLDDLIEQYDKLNGKEELSKEEQITLKGIVEELSTVYSDLNFELDTATGKYSVLTKEIKENRKAMIEAIETETKREKAKTAYSSALGVLDAAGAVSIEELRKERDDLQRLYDEMHERLYPDENYAAGLPQRARDATVWGILGYDSQDRFDFLNWSIEEYETLFANYSKWIESIQKPIQTQNESAPSLETTQDAIDKYTNTVKELEEEHANLNEAISKTVSELKAVGSAVEEQNEHGEISLSTMLSLLETDKDYVRALDIQGDKIRLNIKAVEELNALRRREMLIDSLVAEQKKKTAAEEAKAVVGAKIQEMLAQRAYIESLAASATNNQIMQMLYDSAAQVTDTLLGLGIEINKLNEDVGTYDKTIDIIQGLIDGTFEWEDALEGVGDAAEEANDKYKEFINTILEALRAEREAREENLELAEKQNAVEKERQELLKAMEQRTTRVFNSRTGQWEYQANAKDILQEREDLENAVDELDKYLENNAWDEVEKSVEEGVYDLASIKAIIARWASLSISGYTSWKHSILGVIGKYQNENGRTYYPDGSFSDPNLAKSLLQDTSSAQTKAFMDSMGIISGTPTVNYGNSAVYNNGKTSADDNRTYMLNGIPVSIGFAREHTIEEAFELLSLTD